MLRLLLSTLVLTTILSCGSNVVEKTAPSSLPHLKGDCQAEPVEVQYARNFSISDYGAYKVAEIHFHSEYRDLLFDQKIVFAQHGTSVPQLTGDLANAWLVQVPLQTAAANDDGEITRLKTLELTENIIAMGGGGIYDDNLRQRWENEQIASIGYSFHQPPQPEKLLTLKPDVLFLYAYDQNRLESVGKLRQLGINAIPQFAWAEPTFLGKAEWIKFSALFFCKEKEANDIFEQVLTRCQKLMAMAATQAPKKRSFLVYHPSGESDWNAHRNDFYSAFLEAAGTENVLKDDGPTHAVGINNELLLSLAKDADYWIVNNTSDQNWPPASYLQSFKAYRNQDVYHYQKRTRYDHDAYDWYETPEVRPDLVLEDLVAIFYPELLPGHKLLFFEKVKLLKS